MRLPAWLFLLASSCGPRPSASTGTPPPAQPSRPQHQQHPCDPVSSRKPAPPPPDTGAVCGNGVIEDIAGTCFEVCAGGCGIPMTCSTECTNDREHCDGRETTYSCEAEGYAGGKMGCTKECNLDHTPCVACVPGNGVRCGSAALTGDEVHVVANKTKAAVFTRSSETGQITGAKVDAALRASRLSGLPTKTLAASGLDGSLGFVDAKRRFGTLDLDGRARILGPIGGESPQIEIARETFATGGAAVLTGDYQRRTLAIFDGPSPAPRDQPRHFYLSNHRFIVIPGTHELARTVTGGKDLVVLVFGNEIFAYTRDGVELTRLPATPPGFEIAFTYPAYTDTIRWSSGQIATTRRTNPDVNAPVPGLSRAALSGADLTSAFGGVLMANRRSSAGRERTELYWQAGADPIAPSRSAANTTTP